MPVLSPQPFNQVTNRQGIHEWNKVIIEAVPKTINKDKVLMNFYKKIMLKKGHNKDKIATARKILE